MNKTTMCKIKNCKLCRQLEIINKFIFLPIFIFLMITFVNAVTPSIDKVNYDYGQEQYIRPELKEGLGEITYYNTMLKINPTAEQSTYIGTYNKKTHDIEISLQSSNMKKTLCHELMHHKWFTMMTEKEKLVWINEFNNLDKEIKELYESPTEYHSYTNEKNYGECYYEK